MAYRGGKDHKACKEDSALMLIERVHELGKAFGVILISLLVVSVFFGVLCIFSAAVNLQTLHSYIHNYVLIILLWSLVISYISTVGYIIHCRRIMRIVKDLDPDLCAEQCMKVESTLDRLGAYFLAMGSVIKGKEK